MIRTPAAAVWAAVVLCLAPAFARAGEELDRIDFIETRLEAARPHAEWWLRGWFAFFAGSAVASGGMAYATRSAPDRTAHLVNAGKSLLGLADLVLFQPRGAADGAAGLPAGEATAAERLARAEERLERNAREAGTRHAWLRHLLVTAVNLGGGLAVGLAHGRWGTAGLNAAVGIAVGEASIWTQSWQAEADWDEYRARFASPAGAGIPAGGAAWSFAAGPAGAAVTIDW